MGLPFCLALEKITYFKTFFVNLESFLRKDLDFLENHDDSCCINFVDTS